MEILDLHDQFERLVAEMDKLRTATALVDEAGTRSASVLDRGEDLLKACGQLVEEAGTVVGSATGALREEAASLQAFRGEIAEALTELQSRLQEHAERTEATLRETNEEQTREQHQTTDKVRETIQESSGALGSEVRAALESAATAHSEHMERVQNVVLEDSKAARQWLAEGLTGRVGQLEKRLVDQGAKAAEVTNAVRDEVESLKSRVTWAFALVVVLQAAILAALLLR